MEEEEVIKAFEQEWDKTRFVFKIRTAQLVWLMVWSPVRTHVWAVGSVPSGAWQDSDNQ